MKQQLKVLPMYIGLAWILSAAVAHGGEPGRLTMAVHQNTSNKAAATYEHVHSLAMDSGGQTLFLGTHAGLFRSDDRGRSWKKVSVGTKHAHLDVMDIAPEPREPKRIYIATHEAGVLKSTDGGQTWKDASSGLGGADVHGLAVDPTMPFKLHAAVRDKGEGIYRTTDKGSKWVRVDDGPQGEIKVLRSVNIPTGMGGIFLYAGTSRGLQRSPDCF
jgi:photosystem II stability/assembly factor-like uncharacterized protein